MRKKLMLALLGFSLAVSVASPAEADDGAWRFQLAPYAWLMGIKGSVSTLPRLPDADIDVNFYDDILGNLNGALTLLGEARKGKFGVMADIAYMDLEADNQTPKQFFSSVNARLKSWIVSSALFYRVAENKGGFLDVMAGARYWSLDAALTLEGGLLRQRQVSHKEDWVDPQVGLKGMLPLGGSKFYVSGFFFLGGFGVASDLMWEANLNLGYKWTEGFSTTIGYRYLDVDYEDGDFKYDVAMQGPIIGFSWRF